MKAENVIDAIGVLIIVALVAFFAGHATGSLQATAYERAAAVKAGAARYDADPQTGEVRFAYK